MAKKADVKLLAIARALQSPSKEGVAQSVVNRILDLIRTGMLRAGDRLPSERELIEILDISRPSLREALRALSMGSAIDRDPATGVGRVNARDDLDQGRFARAVFPDQTMDLAALKRPIDPFQRHGAAEPLADVFQRKKGRIRRGSQDRHHAILIAMHARGAPYSTAAEIPRRRAGCAVTQPALSCASPNSGDRPADQISFASSSIEPGLMSSILLARIVRISFSTFTGPSPGMSMRAARRLIYRINGKVQREDEGLIESVQAGLGTSAYGSGYLSEKEACLRQLHDMVRAAIPVARRPEAPAPGTVAAANAALA